MTNDPKLCGLIDQCRLTREIFYIRKGQELSPDSHGRTVDSRHELTKNAEVAWRAAEVALWKHKASVEHKAG